MGATILWRQPTAILGRSAADVATSIGERWMHHGFNWIVLAGLTFASTALTAESGSANASSAECPAPSMRKPDYPPHAARSGRQGTTLLDVRIDECGRILEARVAQTSGSKSLDAAALGIVPKWVLSAATRDKAVNGWVSVPVDFTIRNDIVSKAVDWPKSHKRPRYVLMAAPGEYSSATQANNAILDSDRNVVRPPVINVPHRFVQSDGPSGLEFWLFLRNKGGDTAYAARFRPVMEGDEPVVQVAPLCEFETEDACTTITDSLLKGLPFAPAKLR